MASSSSYYGHRWKYDVFVSFRGEDIRKSFLDHLFSDFKRKGIYAFRDDDLKRGEEISSELYKVIEQSRFLIIIFSKNYAFSTWCLRELVKILKCKEIENKYEIRTLFYNVKPIVVENQTESYEKAFMKHEASNRIEVSKWKKALTLASTLSGWDLEDMSNGYESKFIDAISKEIFNKLTDGPLHVGDNLVGLNSRAEQMNLLQFVGSTKVNTIGICGIGGIGKTTIAKAIYNLLYMHFEASSFCEDVKGVEKRHGLVHLQEKLIDDLMKTRGLKIRSIGQGISVMKQRMGAKKVLVVLDDVNHFNQFEALSGTPSWFGPGSLVIVTSRDKQLPNAHGFQKIYEVDLLDEDEALELFSLNAFRDKNPKGEFLEVSREVVEYVKGLPLALKVLGCFLFGKTLEQWKSELEKLRRYPNSQVQQVLRISYDALDFCQRNVFLDIACFFKGEKKEYVMKILDGCELFFATNARVLVDKSLMSIHEDRLEMHDLVQEMGWQIVHEESEEPGKRSRVWFPTDVSDVLNKDKGSQMVKGLALDVSSSEVDVCGKTFTKMNNLRLLHLYIGSWNNLRDINGKICESKWGVETKVTATSARLEYLSSELRLFCWHGFPFEQLPSTFYPESLVVLDMSYSCIKQLWSGSKSFKKLTLMKLSECRNLRKTPDFTQIPNLEELILDGCQNLIQVHPSVGFLKKLIILNLKKCTSLTVPRNLFESESIQILNLSGCRKLDKFPENLGKMKALMELHADGTAIKELPSSISYLSNLQVFSLGQRKMIRSKSWGSIFKPSFSKPKSSLVPLVFPTLFGSSFLRNVDVSHCNLTGASLNGIECLSLLQTLNLSGNGFKRLPEGLSRLSRLETLGLVGCKNIEELPELPPNIQLIEAQDCTSLRQVPKQSNMYKSTIQCFDFTNCTNIIDNQTVESLLSILLPQGRIDPYTILSIFLPGSRIPNWFSHQSNGDCVKIELPLDWCYEKFKGIAICLVFTPKNPNKSKRSSYNSIGYRFTNFDDSPIGTESPIPDSVFQYENIGIVSDQMFLAYHKSEQIWEKAKEFITVTFEVYGADCVVKKCGARLVLEEDEQQQENGGLRTIRWLPPPISNQND